MIVVKQEVAPKRSRRRRGSTNPAGENDATMAVFPHENNAKSCQNMPNVAKSCQNGQNGEAGALEPLPNTAIAAESDSHSGPRPLKPNQHRALAALLEAPSVAAAARVSGIGLRTLHRWLNEDPDFQDELRRLRARSLDHAATRLQSTAQQAVQAMVDLLASKQHIESGRAALVRTALDFAFRAGSYTDLAGRLDNLEEAAEELKDQAKNRDYAA